MRLVSVQTGVARPLAVGGRRVLSAIGKAPVNGPVTVGPLGLEGDELVFPGCVLRVTAPREPCAKFGAVTGLPDAGRRMVERASSGWYLAVVQPGTVEAGQPFTLRPGPRGLSVADAFLAKRVKHRR